MHAPLIAVVASLGLLASCSIGKPSFALPDRNDDAVKAEEARVAAVLEGDASGKLLSRPLQGPASCKVRLLRKAGSVDYVYAECAAGQEGLSFPIKLDGTTVNIPIDGSEYAPSIRRLFPSDIAAALTADEQRYKP